MAEQLKLIYEKIIFDQNSSPEYAQNTFQELKRNGIVIGTDEAGRGALAGPVVAAAVYLTQEQEEKLISMKLRDSKLISEGRREKLFSAMNELKVLWRTAMTWPKTIDQENILRSSISAMLESVRNLTKILPENPYCLIVDGNSRIDDIDFLQWDLVKADMKIPTVSAASIVAKVLRDRLMRNYDKLYPVYDFKKNKGYPTKFHIEAIKKFGIVDIHRKTFCSKFLEWKE